MTQISEREAASQRLRQQKRSQLEAKMQFFTLSLSRARKEGIAEFISNLDPLDMYRLSASTFQELDFYRKAGALGIATHFAIRGNEVPVPTGYEVIFPSAWGLEN